MSLFREMGIRFWLEKAEVELQALKVAVAPPSRSSPSRG